ncbi:class I SAM-dependent methyltransferase [Rhodopirellula halodulae]|uniref:class I SAM-dependent methyltransferase n=1 Tax=Rhodopirellula halodulae TaxID=2894198 RepID=UPI001E55913D|nr:class I SAM-dependent methyltransferase [Rhodopirellula sp. JC737]MCC9655276.1 class I SAM-dependent methyltransferase [Rhodopirellula sp. JC737]
MTNAIVTLSMKPQIMHPKCRSNYAYIADKWGVELHVLEEPTAKDLECHPHWHKQTICRYVQENLPHVERVLQLDDDLLFRSDCPNLFDIVPEDKFGACSYLPNSRSVRAQNYWSQRLGIPSQPKYLHFNGGMYLYSIERHSELLKSIDAYSLGSRINFDRYGCPDENATCVKLLHEGVPIYSIPMHFNTWYPKFRREWARNRVMRTSVYHFGAKSKKHIQRCWWNLNELPADTEFFPCDKNTKRMLAEIGDRRFERVLILDHLGQDKILNLLSQQQSAEVSWLYFEGGFNWVGPLRVLERAGVNAANLNMVKYPSSLEGQKFDLVVLGTWAGSTDFIEDLCHESTEVIRCEDLSDLQSVDSVEDSPPEPEGRLIATAAVNFAGMIELTLPYALDYAEQVDADILLVTGTSMHEPPFAKYELVHEAVRAGYDQLLLLDADVLPRSGSPDIFEHRNGACSELHLRIPTRKTPPRDLGLNWLMRRDECWPADLYWNTGVVCLDSVGMRHLEERIASEGPIQGVYWEQEQLNQILQSIPSGTADILDARFNVPTHERWTDDGMKREAFFLHANGYPSLSASQRADILAAYGERRLLPEVFDQAIGIAGQTTREELIGLATLAARVPEGSRFVEVGSYAGRSALAIGLHLPKSCGLTMIDPWRAVKGWRTREQMLGIRKSAEGVLANLRRSSVDAEIRVGDSLPMASSFPDASLGAVFIDAMHEYEHVAADISAWLPKVMPGGYICGHDYCPEWPGVIQAVEELVGRCSRIGSLWFKRV